MNQPATELLRRLLAQADRGRARSSVLPVTKKRAPEYFRIQGIEARDSLHAILENAQSAGAVKLEWGRYEARQDLLRIRLVDAEHLAAFLGVERAGTRAERIRQRIEPLLAECPGWLRDAFGEALEKWGSGGKAFGLNGEEFGAIEVLFRTAAAVTRGEHEGLDLRRFSNRLLGDSKAVEAMAARLADLLRSDPALADLANDELFHALGLEKFPPPLFLKGPLRLSYGGEALDIATLRPYIALSPDAVRNIEPVRPVPYLLSIENLSSFQRHVREIADDGLVLYTGGFPGPDFRSILQLLDRCMEAGVPFYHWGDIDLGGLRIFEHIAAVLERPLLPHLMEENPADAVSKPLRPKDRRILERKATNSGDSGRLTQSWLALNIRFMEQEAVDPVAPV